VRCEELTYLKTVTKFAFWTLLHRRAKPFTPNEKTCQELFGKGMKTFWGRNEKWRTDVIHASQTKALVPIFVV
jgi:hypothetical protein